MQKTVSPTLTFFEVPSSCFAQAFHSGTLFNEVPSDDFSLGGFVTDKACEEESGSRRLSSSERLYARLNQKTPTLRELERILSSGVAATKSH